MCVGCTSLRSSSVRPGVATPRKSPALTREAAEGTRTLDLLHGKQRIESVLVSQTTCKSTTYGREGRLDKQDYARHGRAGQGVAVCVGSAS